VQIVKYSYVLRFVVGDDSSRQSEQGQSKSADGLARSISFEHSQKRCPSRLTRLVGRYSQLRIQFTYHSRKKQQQQLYHNIITNTSTTNVIIVMVGASAAGRLIQKRATTGSLTSVFYLRSSGMKEAKTAENIFLVGIGIPMA
jgi:hypothetical protein